MANDYDIGAAFQAIEDELIASMIRNMKHHRAWEDEEGIQWEQWQALQLKALEDYKRKNQNKYGSQFKDINKSIVAAIQEARLEGNMDQEIKILRAIKNGFKGQKPTKGASAEFFKLNDRKLEALIKATTADMEQAETAVLRMANDQYRKVIFNAQVYANTGAGTYEKAVDMATKKFLSAGLNCIEYANGARHTIADYADMAIRTASKRAYLQGEGEKRQEWGIHTVIMNKRGNPCPKCLPFVGKIMIDDVWSGGSKADGDYPLMSNAISAGLYHPRCKDSHTTYFPGISTPPNDKFTKKELSDIEETSRLGAKAQYADRQVKRYDRLTKHSLDEENRKKYRGKKKYWNRIKSIYDTLTEHKPIVLSEIESKHKDEIIQMLSKSDAAIREITMKYLNSIKFVNEKALGRAVTTPRGIRVNLEKDMVNTRGMYTSTFHEIGHCIDRAGQGLSYQTAEFKDALYSDFHELVNAYIMEYDINKESAYKLISKELLTNDRHAISDIVGGLTQNECVGKYSHDTAYWELPHKIEAEAFAHFYEALARNDTTKIMYLSELFPEATKEFIKIVGK